MTFMVYPKRFKESRVYFSTFVNSLEAYIFVSPKFYRGMSDW